MPCLVYDYCNTKQPTVLQEPRTPASSEELGRLLGEETGLDQKGRKALTLKKFFFLQY
jgi:hypothetical protein